MSNRVEYSWHLLMLLAAIGAFFFYQRAGGIQDNDQQQNTVAPDDAQQIVMNNSRGDDRLAKASPSVGGNISPASPAVAETIDKEGARGLNELGMRYLNGTSVERDLYQTTEWLTLRISESLAK